MKRIIWICLAVLFIVPTLSQAGIIGPANIRFIEGDVMFRTPDDDEWLPAAINTPLDEGDAVWCSDDSRVEIQLPDGSLVRMDGGSELELIANEDGFTHLHLASGRLYLRTSQSTSNDALQIDADNTSVLPAARTRLRIDMLPNDQEDVAIFKGTAYVEGNGSRTKVRAGEHIALEEGHSELLPLNPSDNWEYWNLERDRAQSRSAKLNSYLPDELRAHAAELDANGSWVRVPEYGMVWRPSVIVSNEWAPYRQGRWVWKGDDYVWISSESWGWVPYHYGRWAVVSGFGWCWVPPLRGDVYWGPGYVGWFNTGSQVGWTPLAPGETFYGRRYYGRHSAIATSARINPATIAYRNRYNPGGLTVIQHNDFLRGRTIVQQPARGTSISVSVSVGSPRIKPLRETRMPIVKQTPPRVAPPRIEQRDHRDLRTRFPRIAPAAGAEHRRQQPVPAATAPAPASGQTPPLRGKRTVLPVTPPNVNTPDPGVPSRELPAKRDENRGRSTAPQPVPRSEPAASGGAPLPSEQPRRAHTPATTPAPQPQREQPKREGDRPRPVTPQAAPQAIPAPAVTVPQRPEQPRQQNTPALTPASQPPREQPKREEGRARPATPQFTPPQTPAASVVPPQRAEPPKRITPALTPPPEAAPPRGERAPAKEVGKEKKVWRVTTPENTGDRDTREKDHKDRERR